MNAQPPNPTAERFLSGAACGLKEKGILNGSLLIDLTSTAFVSAVLSAATAYPADYCDSGILGLLVLGELATRGFLALAGAANRCLSRALGWWRTTVYTRGVPNDPDQKDELANP